MSIEMKTCYYCEKQYEDWVDGMGYDGNDYCKCCMINEVSHEEVYQVRINGGDKGFIGGDMKCIDDCWRAINDYHYKNNGVDKGDEISITLTPLLSEDIHGELGLEYNIRVLYTIRPYETRSEKIRREVYEYVKKQI